jgi:hypothetical protein
MIAVAKRVFGHPFRYGGLETHIGLISAVETPIHFSVIQMRPTRRMGG